LLCRPVFFNRHLSESGTRHWLEKQGARSRCAARAAAQSIGVESI
jgi:hypothetical protein